MAITMRLAVEINSDDSSDATVRFVIEQEGDHGRTLGGMIGYAVQAVAPFVVAPDTIITEANEYIGDRYVMQLGEGE